MAELIGRVPKEQEGQAFVYRVHDARPEKLDTFNTFILRFGHKIKATGTKVEVAKSINSLLDKIQGRPEENLIETIAIRTMSKAVYSTKNVGITGWRSTTTLTLPRPSAAIPICWYTGC